VHASSNAARWRRLHDAALVEALIGVQSLIHKVLRFMGEVNYA
jgi:hypothetical protein